MALPMNPGDVHTDRPLTNFLFKNPDHMFVAHRVFPVVPVRFEGDKYYKIYPSNRIRKNTVRAPNTESVETHFEYTSESYTCEEFAAHADIPGRVVANSEDPLSPREDAAWQARQTVMLDIERRVAALAMASSLPKGDPTATWDNATLSSAKPAKDIWTGKEAVRKKIGVFANAVLMSAAAANALSIWLLEQKNGAGVEFANVEQYLRAGELPPTIWGCEVIIGGANYSTELRPSDVDLSSVTDIWTDNVTLFYKTPRPGIRSATFGSTFRVRNSEKASSGRYTEGHRHEGDQWAGYVVNEDHKVVSEDCCYMIENVLE